SMKSASILPLILATRLRRLTADATTFRLFCSGCATDRCLGEKRVLGFTNTRARYSSLTTHSPSGDARCTLCGRESGRFARGRGLRNDSGNRFRAVPWRAVALRRTLWVEQSSGRTRKAGADRGEILALRDFEK